MIDLALKNQLRTLWRANAGKHRRRPNKAKPGPTVGLVGSHENIAERLVEYRDAGFSTFILAGNPHLEEALRIGQEVLPLVHQRPAASSTDATLKASA